MHTTAGLWTWPVWGWCSFIDIGSGHHGNWRFLVEAGELQRTDVVVMRTHSLWIPLHRRPGEQTNEPDTGFSTSLIILTEGVCDCTLTTVPIHCSTSRLRLSRCHLKMPSQVRNKPDLYSEGGDALKLYNPLQQTVTNRNQVFNDVLVQNKMSIKDYRHTHSSPAC